VNPRPYRSWPSFDTIRTEPTTHALAVGPFRAYTAVNPHADRPIGDDMDLQDVDPGDLW
jgi:hypothetical protein